MIIAVDFDGTIVEHIFPEIGQPVPGAIEWLKQWKNAGAKLILWTMRSSSPPSPNGPPYDGDSNHLTDNPLRDAVEWCKSQGIHFDSVNEGIDDREWTTSPKAYAQVYIDDAAFGCPLIQHPHGGRPMVDWSIVGPAVFSMLSKSV